MTAALLVVLVLTLRRVWWLYESLGLFNWIGRDWAYYYAQSIQLWSGVPSSIYDVDALTAAIQQLARYTRQPTVPLEGGHVPYPPVFAWLFTPFTWPSPPQGFAAWTVISLLATLGLCWRISAMVSPGNRPLALLLLLSSLPLAETLILGQPMVLLTWAFLESYRSFRSGQELRAGLWLSLLFIKPQYGLLLGMVLLWKRRWYAVGGAILGVFLLIGASLWVAGVPALMKYPASIAEEDASFRSPTSHPQRMVNWRSLLLATIPTIGNRTGIAATVMLGGATVVLAALAWRGPWAAQGELFPHKMAILLLATVLATYHSHLHGVLLLAAPLACVLSCRVTSSGIRMVLLIAMLAPSANVVIATLAPGASPGTYLVFTLALVAMLLLLFGDVWRRSRANAVLGDPHRGSHAHL